MPQFRVRLELELVLMQFLAVRTKRFCLLNNTRMMIIYLDLTLGIVLCFTVVNFYLCRLFAMWKEHNGILCFVLFGPHASPILLVDLKLKSNIFKFHLQFYFM
jgi:hypothetical protein